MNIQEKIDVVIPAQPGFFLVAENFDGDFITPQLTPILGWQTHELDNERTLPLAYAVPIVAFGVYEDAHAVLSPDGVVRDLFGETWPSLDAWTKAGNEELLAAVERARVSPWEAKDE